MPSTNYDPRYPFGKPSNASKTTEAKKSEQPAQEKKASSTKQSKSVKEKQGHPVRNTIIALCTLGALGAAGYFGYEWYQDAQAKDVEPVQTQPTGPILHCPVFKQGTVNATLEEREAYAYILGGLDTAEPFPRALRTAVARSTLVGLESGLSKAEALERAEKALFDGIIKDAGTAIFEKNGVRYCVPSGLARLETNFPTNAAVQNRDLPYVLQAIPFCLETLKANLDAYSEDEARTMLETFGQAMVIPNLGREASREAGKDQEWAIETQKAVLQGTLERLHGETSPHEAICQAINAEIKDEYLIQSPMFVYTQAQTARILQGKTQAQMKAALRENLTQLMERPKEWMGRNDGWLSSRSPVRPQNTQGGANR